MEVQIKQISGISWAELSEENYVISDSQEALELIMNASYQGADALIVQRHQLNPEFFELKTRLAGDILQKFSTYDFRLAIIGDFNHETSQSLKDFIFESNKQGRIIFVDSLEKATQFFGRNQG